MGTLNKQHTEIQTRHLISWTIVKSHVTTREKILSVETVLMCLRLLLSKILHLQTLFIYLAFDFCRFCVIIRFFHPRHNGQWPPTSRDFLSQIVSTTFIFLSYFLRKSQYFPFLMFSAKQGNYWYHFITYLVWRGPWLGIEPGTSRTRCQHYTTKLSRRPFLQRLETRGSIIVMK